MSKRTTAVMTTSAISWIASAAAYAQAASSGVGPTWELVATGACGVIVGIISLWVASVSSRIDRVSDRVDTNLKNISRLETTLRGEYHTKPDIRETLVAAVQPLRDDITELRKSVELLFNRTSKGG